jgi:hypothetical protein
MFALSAAAWIAIALLTPFWWALGLLILALLGDVWPRWRPHVSRLFDRLDRTRVQPSTRRAISTAAAA